MPASIEELRAKQAELIREAARAVTERDRIIILAAEQLIKQWYQKDWHHLAACGWGEQQAEHYSALQLNCKRARESSVCAEAGIIMAASMKGDEVLTIVTFHGNHNGGKPYVVPPCAMCLARFRRFAQNCEVIVGLEGSLVKLPQEIFSAYPYPVADTG